MARQYFGVVSFAAVASAGETVANINETADNANTRRRNTKGLLVKEAF